MTLIFSSVNYDKFDAFFGSVFFYTNDIRS